MGVKKNSGLIFLYKWNRFWHGVKIISGYIFCCISYVSRYTIRHLNERRARRRHRLIGMNQCWNRPLRSHYFQWYSLHNLEKPVDWMVKLIWFFKCHYFKNSNILYHWWLCRTAAHRSDLSPVSLNSCRERQSHRHTPHERQVVIFDWSAWKY